MNIAKNNIDEVKVKAILNLLTHFNDLFAKHQRESEECLLKWARYLSSRNLTVKQIAFALSELNKNNLKFMPSAHEIIGVLIPSKESKEFKSEKIATEIHEALIDTLAGRKTNFTDEIDDDALTTINVLGGYRVLKNMDLADSYNRSRVTKAAMAILVTKEANARNAKLIAQGIPCNTISNFDMAKLGQDYALVPKTENRQGTQTTLQMVSENALYKSLKEIKESIPDDSKTTKEAPDAIN